jgi:hypothetical protein
MAPAARPPVARRPFIRADRWDIRAWTHPKGFENPLAVWLITLLAWAADTLWLADKHLLGWLPTAPFYYLLLLVVPPSLAVLPRSGWDSLPVRRMRVWLSVGSLLALGPGLVVGPILGLFVGGTWALGHKPGGFGGGFVHGAAVYGAGLVFGVQLAALVAALVTLVARVLAIALWMILGIVAFGAVFWVRHGPLWGGVAAICGFFFVISCFEFVMDEMPDD